MHNPIATPDVPDNHQTDVMAHVAAGQEVFDSRGHKVGKVDNFFAGAGSATPQETIVLPAPLAPTSQQTMPLMEPVLPVTRTATVPEFDTVLHPDENLPRELRERLAHDGFIRIDAGLLHHHRYALRDQIERAEGGRVVLNVGEDELIKH